tara:strand:+ start:1029 stop:1382 length:354 start_codon:yes stop_codon:yes gene_type:complete
MILHFKNTSKTQLFLISVAAVLGAFIRWQIDNNIIVNIIGSFVIGLILGSNLNDKSRLIIGGAFCGSLTTFSGFFYFCFNKLINGFLIEGILLIIIQISISLCIACIGFLLGKKLHF